MANTTTRQISPLLLPIAAGFCKDTKSQPTAQFGAMNMEGEIAPKTVEDFLLRKANCQEEKFQKSSTPSKHLIDTIKMIAYRAETAMANLLRDKMKHPDESRSLLRALYTSDADLLPPMKPVPLRWRQGLDLPTVWKSVAFPAKTAHPVPNLPIFHC